MTADQAPTLDDLAAAPAAPPVRKRGRPRTAKDAAPAAPSRGPGRPSKSDQLQRQLGERFALWFGMASVACAGGDPERYNAVGSVSRDFVIVTEQAAELARCLVKASERNKALRRALEMLVEGGDSVELVTVVLGGIALPIAANHGLMPPGPAATLFGAPTPPTPPAGPVPVPDAPFSAA